MVSVAKLGRRPFHAWAQLPAQWTLVTDDSVHPDAVAPFIAAGVNVVVVNETGTGARASDDH